MERTSPPATTYQETSGRYAATGDARERFEELVVRDVRTRAFMAVVAAEYAAAIARADLAAEQ